NKKGRHWRPGFKLCVSGHMTRVTAVIATVGLRVDFLHILCNLHLSIDRTSSPDYRSKQKEGDGSSTHLHAIK
ncbi:hypothetical protein, partial [Klebsiella michiganensis]|uniref:hypothetical protein n=1 Tax=Klebsiella michiganensis TaxID=1134687 RepID=UPI002570A1ED